MTNTTDRSGHTVRSPSRYLDMVSPAPPPCDFEKPWRVGYCGLRHTDSCKRNPLALEVYSSWLNTLGLWYNRWPSWWYSLHMTNCVRCVQLIEADPHNLTKYSHSLPDLHQDYISSSNNTSIPPSLVLWYCRFILIILFQHQPTETGLVTTNIFPQHYWQRTLSQ